VSFVENKTGRHFWLIIDVVLPFPASPRRCGLYLQNISLEVFQEQLADILEAILEPVCIGFQYRSFVLNT
jgi:hypothetical protein